MADGNEGTTEKRHLRVLRTSQLKTWLTCPRKYKLEYIDGYTPVDEALALRLGTVWHAAMEIYLAAIRDGTEVLAGLAAIEGANLDPIDLAKLRPMYLGYCARWEEHDREHLRTISIEREYQHELKNPDTGGTSQTWAFGGRLDGEVIYYGQPLVIEHKTSSENIEPGSDYWRQKRMDAQASNYLAATKAEGNLYDVAKKPTLRPAKATPLEQREYTKPKDKACPDCKKKNAPPAPHFVDIGEGRTAPCVEGRVVTDPGGKLYANMRAEDETLEAFEARILASISENPDAYYQRGVVVRTADELEEAARDRWSNGRAIREAELAQRFPRNSSSCFPFGGRCPFVDVCAGEADITDPTRFTKKEGF